MSMSQTVGRGEYTSVPEYRPSPVAPLILGFAAPLLVIVFLDPPFLREAREAFLLFMAVLFLIVLGFFIFAMFAPKNLATMSYDRSGDQLILVYTNYLSMEQRAIPMERVRSVKARVIYDHDGYPQYGGEVQLLTGEKIALPFSPPETCLT